MMIFDATDRSIIQCNFLLSYHSSSEIYYFSALPCLFWVTKLAGTSLFGARTKYTVSYIMRVSVCFIAAVYLIKVEIPVIIGHNGTIWNMFETTLIVKRLTAKNVCIIIRLPTTNTVLFSWRCELNMMELY